LSGNLSVQALSDAIGSIVQKRLRDGSLNRETKGEAPPIAVPPPGAGAGGSSAAPIVFTVGQPIPKVDVVVFQDCWMGTLETAFELQDDARYLVLSQSLVPAGFAPGQLLGAVWPYERLISIFLRPAPFAAPMMQELKDFFDGVGLPPGTAPDYNRYPATKVLFSLMDCGATAGKVSADMTPEWQALVQALYDLGKPGRSALIEQPGGASGRLFETAGADLRVGDQALIDILTFCAYLQTPNQWLAAVGATTAQKNAITSAGAALQNKVGNLILEVFQSPPPAAGDPAYTGVAVLYKPLIIVGNDPYIVGAFRVPYETLRFSKETRVMPPPGGGAAECSWTQYAFDRYKWF